MGQKSMNPSLARKNFYRLLKEVNEDHRAVEIIDEQNENNAVLVSLEYWRSIQETLYLEETGVLNQIREREQGPSEFIDVNNIEWQEL
ncbi:prevent-host-death protein [Tetragenococcus osmophilus]|uniref:Antitoxin n=1 Tax=Tetragenococcus osmophilus TaxID=526944 RepID=A0AA37XM90_9ENTE|nr:type II toxin-antitoxin system Phd/YefM family antitoxin [Tetragenococcus osmophilus]GMA52663.1 antitoxin [Alicyclobacillus contaminans]AYW47164.1 prevent-host-death protein [Tetragenococcus osmophilus]GMA55252.1 antitoxin [Alicyclobacillus contaminans]GMA55319.1 antitoxin [Alicyclobacillus contaminans]GMA70982.1 antitoxin [Tetragenococcus osmophilus]